MHKKCIFGKKYIFGHKKLHCFYKMLHFGTKMHFFAKNKNLFFANNFRFAYFRISGSGQTLTQRRPVPNGRRGKKTRYSLKIICGLEVLNFRRWGKLRPSAKNSKHAVLIFRAYFRNFVSPCHFSLSPDRAARARAPSRARMCAGARALCHPARTCNICLNYGACCNDV